MTLPSTKAGRVVAVSVSDRKGIKKHNMAEAELIVQHGLADDAHAGTWHRQVSLLGAESIAKVQAKGVNVVAGDFAENITTKNICLWQLPLGTRFRIGARAVVEVTQIGKTCHQRCAIFHQVGDCVMPREGIFTRVIEAGTIRPGDNIRPA